MTQVEERLARLETKVDAHGDLLKSIAEKLDGKLDEHTTDLVKVKLQLKWITGLVALAALGGGGIAGVLKIIGV